MTIRLYASHAPSWWPFQLATPSYTPSCSKCESIIVDNGAFTYHVKGSYPPLDLWMSLVAKTAAKAAARSSETIIILPDIVGDPVKTLELVRKTRGHTACTIHKCIPVVQWSRNTIEKALTLVEEYVEMGFDYVAVAMKAPSTIYYSSSGRRRVTDTILQKRMLLAIGQRARKLGLKIHLLAPSVDTIVYAGLSGLADSVDTTVWTRAATQSLKKRYGTVSARTGTERELLFTEFLEYLKNKGIALEAWG